MNRSNGKSALFGALNLLFCILILALAGDQYRSSSLLQVSLLMPFYLLLTAPFFTAALRRLGTKWVWLGMLAGFGAVYLFSRDLSVAVFVWSACCAIPLAVSLIWPLHPRIKPLAMRALPLAGALALGGILLFHRLRFGHWGFDGIDQRLETFVAMLLNQMEWMGNAMYQGEMQEQMNGYLAICRANLSTLAFSMVTSAVQGFFGLFFWCVWSADHKAGKEGRGRMLGSWRPLIPNRRLSWLYMGGYILLLLVGGTAGQNLAATFDLFGFLFVFSALYYLLQYLRRKQLPPFLRKLLIGGLFLVAYFTVGGGMLLSPYMILLYIGWWIATLPIFISVNIQKK